MAQPLTVLSFDVPETDRPIQGEGKTENDPSNQAHRPLITNRNNGRFRFNLTLVTCIHGKWSAEDATPATFLVFECVVNSLADYKLRRLKMHWDFVNGEELPDVKPAHPEIIALGPELRRYNPSKTGHNDGKEAEFGFDGTDALPVKPTAKMKLSFSKEYQREYYEEVQPMVSPPDANSQKRTRAEWLFKQNKQLGNGIVPTFRTAILLKRASDAPFKGLFTLTEFDAGFRYDIVERWDNFFSSREPNVDDPVNFIPAEGDVGDKDLVDEVKSNLSQLKTKTGAVSKKYAWLLLVDVGEDLRPNQ